MNARFEIEKRKLEQRIKLHESSLFNGLGSWVLGSLSGNGTKKQSFVEKSMELIEQMPTQEKMETLVKASSLFTNKKSGSLGMVVLGSILGGVLTAKVYLGKSKSLKIETDELKNELPETTI